MNYATLFEVKANIRLTNFTTDDAMLTSWIKKSSRLIEVWKDRRYDIRFDTVLVNCPVIQPVMGSYAQQYIPMLTNQELYLKTSSLDLVDITEIVNGDDIEVDVEASCILDIQHGYINRVFLKKNANVEWQLRDGDFRNAISISGYFGCAPNYPECFIGSGESLTAELEDSVTELVVNDYDGVADDLIVPRFQTGQLLRFNSDTGIEFVLIKDITVAENKLHLVRGQNGTDALTHAIGTPIEIFRVDETVTQMVIRLVQWRYRQKDTDTFDKVYNLATQTATTPSALPADVRLILGARGRFKI